MITFVIVKYKIEIGLKNSNNYKRAPLKFVITILYNNLWIEKYYFCLRI